MSTTMTDTAAERAVFNRLRELLSASGERALIGVIVRPLTHTALVQTAFANATPDTLRRAAAELLREATEREMAATPAPSRRAAWWMEEDDD